MGSTKGLLLITETRQLVIKDMDCTYVVMEIWTLLASKKPLLCVEGVNNLVLFILGLTYTKHHEKMAVTVKSV